MTNNDYSRSYVKDVCGETHFTNRCDSTVRFWFKHTDVFSWIDALSKVISRQSHSHEPLMQWGELHTSYASTVKQKCINHHIIVNTSCPLSTQCCLVSVVHVAVCFPTCFQWLCSVSPVASWKSWVRTVWPSNQRKYSTFWKNWVKGELVVFSMSNTSLSKCVECASCISLGTICAVCLLLLVL